MVKVFQILVPDNTLVSRIINCDTQVTELFVIDRADKKFVSDNVDKLSKPALYILINRDKKQLYVGETDDSFKRLRNHEAKDFWTEAIVFHSTNDTFSKTEVKWLEAKTYETLKELNCYDLSENKKEPQRPPLKRNQIYTLEPIFEEAKNYICAAGFDIFLKKKVETEEQPVPHDFIDVNFDKVANNINVIKKHRRPPFKFSMINLKPGDIVVFAPTKIEVKVASDNTIEYNNEIYSLSQFCKEFMPIIGSEHKEYQGPAHFTYNGKTLDKIRKESE